MVESAAKQGLSRPELWERIRAAELPSATIPNTTPWRDDSRYASFEERLKNAYNLTTESARRLVEEYRRYLYMKVVDGGLLTPSMWVDRAWHQHLETEGDAWTQFCDDVLQCPVEHMTGLPPNEAKASYARTLNLYRDEFGEDPPDDVWPSLAKKRRAYIGTTIFILAISLFILGFFYKITGSDYFRDVLALGFFVLLFWAIVKPKGLNVEASCG